MANAGDPLTVDALARLPYAMAAGTIDITPTAHAPSSIDVTFPVNRFTATPIVTVTAHSSVPGLDSDIDPNNIDAGALVEVSTSSLSSTGCTIYIYRLTDTLTSIDWIAVQMEAST